jgi:hypothetical protein
MDFVYSDGGRGAAGFSTANEARDCVCRSIAIATEQPYAKVYFELSAIAKAMGERASARDGLPRPVYDRYLAALGWTWVPTMGIGTGCTVHVRADELPSGRVIVRVAGHLTAVIDGVIHDTGDPSNACVYGYFVKGGNQ